MHDKRHRKVHVGTIDTDRSPSVMDQPKTMSVPAAGRVYYDIGRNASYEAARRGEIPTIRIGRLLRVPVAAIERRLAEVASVRGAEPPR
jgi:hypothetical protein